VTRLSGHDGDCVLVSDETQVAVDGFCGGVGKGVE